SRTLALLLGVIAFALTVTLRTSDWQLLDPWYLDLGFFLGSFILIVGGLPLVHLAVFWRARRPPRPGFPNLPHPGPPVLGPPGSPLFSGWIFISQFGVLAIVLPVGSTWSGAASDPDLVVLRTVLIGVVALAFATHVWALFRPPALRLTPDGLVLNLQL